MVVSHVLPWIAGFGLVGAMVIMAADAVPFRWRGWAPPAVLAAAFLAFSAIAAAVEGPLGFWPEHTRNLWGNQIWFDLLLAAGCCWALILPRARRVGMQPWPWLVLILCTGSIGLLLTVARLLFLEAGRSAAGPADRADAAGVQ